MKLKIFLSLFLIIISSLFGQEITQKKKSEKRFCFSWSASYDGNPEAFSRTSVLGIGITVFSNDQIDIRNQLEFCNGVIVMESLDKSYFKKVLANKISIGKVSENQLFRPYGFIEGRVGTSGEDLYDYLKNPLISNVGLGTGLDIYANKSISWFLEMGFLGNFTQDGFLPQQRFELGFMYHF